MAAGLDHAFKAVITLSAAQIDAALSDFPVLLAQVPGGRQDFPTEIFDSDPAVGAQNGGGDIRFTTDADGLNPIALDIRKFVTAADPTQGSANLVVKVPSVSATVDTDIYVWWGTSGTSAQPAPTDPLGRNAVYSKAVSAGEGGVYDASAGLTDLTGNGFNATIQGTVNTVAGENGDAWDFDANGNFLSASPAVTQDGYAAISKVRTTADVSAWIYDLDTSTDLSDFGDRDQILMSASTSKLFLQRESGGSSFSVDSANAFTSNQWSVAIGRQLASNDHRVILDDGAEAIDTANVAIPAFQSLRIGTVQSTLGSLQGQMESLWFFAVDPGEAFLRTLQNNWSSATFATPGAVESVGGGISVTLIAASETDSSALVGTQKAASLVAAAEVDTPTSLTLQKAVSLITALEEDSAAAVSATGPTTTSLTTVPEADTAAGVGVQKVMAFSVVSETDITSSLTLSKTITLTPATETDSVSGLFTPMPGMEDTARVIQGSLTAATEGRGVAASSQSLALVAYTPPSTRVTGSTQFSGTTSTEGQGIPASSQMVVLVAWRTGAVEDFSQRAWTFTLDGHPFYVLTLGNEKTLVLDLLTGQWSEFATSGLPTWNMEIGLTWKGRVVAGDNQNPLLWRLDPASLLDDGFKPITRLVTGGLPVRQRFRPRQFSFTVTASMGAPVVPVDGVTSTVSLRFSDDAGNTWFDLASIDIVSGDAGQEIAWRSLGSLKAPGRVFELSDVGGFVRIGGADADVEGLE